jgi:prepilin-type N-terminal cleavage/methylation domain-containing protein
MIKKGQQGFTLIEVMVGLAILMMAMTGVFTIYSWCTAEVRRAQYRTLATLCARQMMEMINSTPYHVSAYDGFSTNSSPSTESSARTDLDIWQACIQHLPMPATGSIAVIDDIETPYSNVVQVTILYKNYGRDTTIGVSQKFPAREP